jgi:hypothetical protein
MLLLARPVGFLHLAERLSYRWQAGSAAGLHFDIAPSEPWAEAMSVASAPASTIEAARPPPLSARLPRRAAAISLHAIGPAIMAAQARAGAPASAGRGAEPSTRALPARTLRREVLHMRSPATAPSGMVAHQPPQAAPALVRWQALETVMPPILLPASTPGHEPGKPAPTGALAMLPSREDEPAPVLATLLEMAGFVDSSRPLPGLTLRLLAPEEVEQRRAALSEWMPEAPGPVQAHPPVAGGSWTAWADGEPVQERRGERRAGPSRPPAPPPIDYEALADRVEGIMCRRERRAREIRG